MLKAEDVTATLAWYERVGFKVRGKVPDDREPTWLELERDGVVLQFLGGEIEPAWGPEVREWGMVEMGLQDPNGYFLTFTEPADGA
jgi:hypothetical protein